MTVTESGASGFRMTLRGSDSLEDSSIDEFSVDVVVAEEVSSEEDGMVGLRRDDDMRKDFVILAILIFFGIHGVYLGSNFFYV